MHGATPGSSVAFTVHGEPKAAPDAARVYTKAAPCDRRKGAVAASVVASSFMTSAVPKKSPLAESGGSGSRSLSQTAFVGSRAAAVKNQTLPALFLAPTASAHPPAFAYNADPNVGRLPPFPVSFARSHQRDGFVSQATNVNTTPLLKPVYGAPTNATGGGAPPALPLGSATDVPNPTGLPPGRGIRTGTVDHASPKAPRERKNALPVGPLPGPPAPTSAYNPFSVKLRSPPK